MTMARTNPSVQHNIGTADHEQEYVIDAKWSDQTWGSYSWLNGPVGYMFPQYVTWSTTTKKTTVALNSQPLPQVHTNRYKDYESDDGVTWSYVTQGSGSTLTAWDPLVRKPYRRIEHYTLSSTFLPVANRILETDQVPGILIFKHYQSEDTGYWDRIKVISWSEGYVTKDIQGENPMIGPTDCCNMTPLYFRQIDGVRTVKNVTGMTPGYIYYTPQRHTALKIEEFTIELETTLNTGATDDDYTWAPIPFIIFDTNDAQYMINRIDLRYMFRGLGPGTVFTKQWDFSNVWLSSVNYSFGNPVEMTKLRYRIRRWSPTAFDMDQYLTVKIKGKCEVRSWDIQ